MVFLLEPLNSATCIVETNWEAMKTGKIRNQYTCMAAKHARLKSTLKNSILSINLL